jgi:hypothetical protein
VTGAALSLPLSSSSVEPVAFYAPLIDDLAAAERLDPDKDWRTFGTGFYAWVLQTFLRLHEAGYPVVLTREPPRSGIVVCHHDHVCDVAARAGDSLVVSVRSDRSFQPLAHVEILQNRRFTDDRRTFYAAPWPQPGLKPRDPARGERVEHIAFKGTTLNLHPDFRGERWRRFCAERKITFQIDEARYRNPASRYRTHWNDYREVDAVLAVRPRPETYADEKPASKLVNAWRAGAAAMLGPEFAYRETGRPGVDYLEVRDLEEAMLAVESLRLSPALYRTLVARGRERVSELEIPNLVRHWGTLLFETLPGALLEGRLSRQRRVPVALRRPLFRSRELWLGLRRTRAQRWQGSRLERPSSRGPTAMDTHRA